MRQSINCVTWNLIERKRSAFAGDIQVSLYQVGQDVIKLYSSSKSPLFRRFVLLTFNRRQRVIVKSTFSDEYITKKSIFKMEPVSMSPGFVNVKLYEEEG